MSIIDIERLNDMIQDICDLDALTELSLTKDEIEGYLEFFAANFVFPLTTVLRGFDYEE